ncbi:hypothetical protein PR048_030800 [Dryococelus australis]|uniref:Uncharacterized protein n=1 Tax=Dryococelus australis TaxID=614101 RepID=A0ABQ9G9Y9_9NEOP|nr:hypothetical protein PR048_030800 [Dryococelus australis]
MLPIDWAASWRVREQVLIGERRFSMMLKAVHDKITHLESRRARFDSRPCRSINFRMRESRRTIPLVGGFSRVSPVSSRSFVPALLHTHFASLSSALKTSICFSSPAKVLIPDNSSVTCKQSFAEYRKLQQRDTAPNSCAFDLTVAFACPAVSRALVALPGSIFTLIAATSTMRLSRQRARQMVLSAGGPRAGPPSSEARWRPEPPLTRAYIPPEFVCHNSGSADRGRPASHISSLHGKPLLWPAAANNCRVDSMTKFTWEELANMHFMYGAARCTNLRPRAPAEIPKPRNPSTWDVCPRSCEPMSLKRGESIEQRWNESAGEREIALRKPADRRHRPARFPLEKIRERPRRESNPVRHYFPAELYHIYRASSPTVCFSPVSDHMRLDSCWQWLTPYAGGGLERFPLLKKDRAVSGNPLRLCPGETLGAWIEPWSGPALGNTEPADYESTVGDVSIAKEVRVVSTSDLACCQAAHVILRFAQTRSRSAACVLLAMRAGGRGGGGCHATTHSPHGNHFAGPKRYCINPPSLNPRHCTQPGFQPLRRRLGRSPVHVGQVHNPYGSGWLTRPGTPGEASSCLCLTSAGLVRPEPNTFFPSEVAQLLPFWIEFVGVMSSNSDTAILISVLTRSPEITPGEYWNDSLPQAMVSIHWLLETIRRHLPVGPLYWRLVAQPLRLYYRLKASLGHAHKFLANSGSHSSLQRLGVCTSKTTRISQVPSHGRIPRSPFSEQLAPFLLTSLSTEDYSALEAWCLQGRNCNPYRYKVVSGVVWTNRTMVSSNTDTNRTDILAVVDIVPFLTLIGATVAERLACPPSTKVSRVQSPAGSPDFRKWESCRTMPLVDGFSRGSPASPAPSILRRSIFTSITLISSQDLAAKSHPNLFTHSYTYAH